MHPINVFMASDRIEPCEFYGSGFAVASARPLRTLFHRALGALFVLRDAGAADVVHGGARSPGRPRLSRRPTAGSIYGNYTMAVYMLAVPGGFIADRILGAKTQRADRRNSDSGRALCLAMAVARRRFTSGWILIALGTGLFKPNISALVGATLCIVTTRVAMPGFSIFYMGINVGAFLAPLVTGFLAQSSMFKNWLAATGFDPS